MMEKLQRKKVKVVVIWFKKILLKRNFYEKLNFLKIFRDLKLLNNLYILLLW